MPQSVSVTCPVCRYTFAANVHMTVDVNKEPALKAEVLRRRINQVSCPNCGHDFTAPTPVLYHDGSKNFLGIFVPPNAAQSEDTRQRMIGNLTNRIISGIPTEQRRGYLLQPKQYLTMNSLADAILMADGVTREQLDAQRQRATVMSQILNRATSEDSVKALAKEFDEYLDAAFFTMMEVMAQESRQEGSEQAQQAAQSILSLRQLLLQHCSFGTRLQAQQRAVDALGDQPTREQLLERVIQAEDDEIVDALVVAALPLVDYVFFQKLTERVEQEERQKKRREARRLAQLRDHILDLSNTLNKAAQEAVEEADKVLLALLNSEDLDAAVQEHADDIDDVFMHVLFTRLQRAKRERNRVLVETLERVRSAADALIEAQMPPEYRLIRQLLDEEYPEGTRRLLVERKDEVKAPLLDAMATLADQVGTTDKEMAKRLRAIRSQAALLS